MTTATVATTVLRDLMQERSVLIADGGMGTSLFALGLETGDCPELWNLDQPEKVAKVHAGFVAAGCDLFLTNSFGANRRRLRLHGLADRAGTLNRAAAGIGRRIADDHERRTGRKVAVCGSVGPTGDLLVPVGALSIEEARDTFVEQMTALAEGGVDALWVETLSSREELEAAITAASAIDLPIVATLSFDSHGRTMMGLSPIDAFEIAANTGGTCAAFGANCGVGPSQLLHSILSLTNGTGTNRTGTNRTGTERTGNIPIVAKGNCGIPEYRDGKLTYSGTPEVMADYACFARDAGARIIGGCCGTTPTHIAAMAEAVRTRPAGAPPTVDDIESRFGPIATASTAPETPMRDEIPGNGPDTGDNRNAGGNTGGTAGPRPRRSGRRRG